jgi:hypothetical protein
MVGTRGMDNRQGLSKVLIRDNRTKEVCVREVERTE